MLPLEIIKRTIPDNTKASQSVVSKNWEAFVGTGKINSKDLRPLIANRWQQCRKQSINPFKNRVDTVLSDEELDSKLHSENLGISGKNVLDRMSNSVEGTGHAIILADSLGRILYSVGHNNVRDSLEKINFRPGSQWNESIAGPNGIGTPLALGQPEIILGSEHYCRGWQQWVCYGAPIHNPSDNSILGCVDITGPADNVCIEAMALAMSITQSIESELSVIQLKNREQLRLAFCDLRMRWPNEASLMVDENGSVIDINTHANILLGTTSSILNQSINQTFPGVTAHITKCVHNNREEEIKMESHIGNTHLFLKPIKIEGELLGCFVMIMGDNNIINNFTSLRSKEDDLIKNTLLKTNNNISKAAKILNIDRTTIYRRRKNWQ